MCILIGCAACTNCAAKHKLEPLNLKDQARTLILHFPCCQPSLPRTIILVIGTGSVHIPIPQLSGNIKLNYHITKSSSRQKMKRQLGTSKLQNMSSLNLRRFSAKQIDTCINMYLVSWQKNLFILIPTPLATQTFVEFVKGFSKRQTTERGREGTVYNFPVETSLQMLKEHKMTFPKFKSMQANQYWIVF